MKVLFSFFSISALYIVFVLKWTGVGELVSKKMETNLAIERKAILLAKKNRLLQKKISDFQYKISHLESKLKYYSSVHKSSSRSIASVPKKMKVNDLVEYDVYHWTPEKLLAIAEKEFHFKHYEKSAQFYEELLTRFSQNEIVTDRVLFGAGVAAFESGKRYGFCEKYLALLLEKFPRSDFSRGAKLWLALAQYNQGQFNKFTKTVEEFRIKYRNTDEWKILSRYYENLSEKKSL